MKVNTSRIPSFRALSQKIVASEFTAPGEVVRWMGAIQAQDFPMAQWAIGLRLGNPSLDKIRKAFDAGEIIRTHAMRPTWHFVSSADIYWMLDLTSGRITSSMKSRHKAMELSRRILSTCNKIFEKALTKENSLTREEMAKRLNEAGIKTTNNRLSHILFMAELDGLICSGPMNGNRQTYALLAERVPKKKMLTRDQSLAELARRYFTSRGPATVRDFAWWSGLSLTESRQALDSIKSQFISEACGTETYWLAGSFNDSRIKSPFVRLLPAYDELLISYKDRSAALSLAPMRTTISDNGIFRPVIAVNGQVTGLWKRTIDDTVKIEASLFRPLHDSTIGLLEKEAERFSLFLGKRHEIVVSLAVGG